MKKKGELTSEQIIGLVLVIAGLIIVLIAAFMVFDIRNQSGEQVCELSIVTRATIPESTQNLAPIKCTAKKYCVSLSGQDCEQFTGESPIEKIKLPSGECNEEKCPAARKIEETSANAMYDCWSITGKGKLDLFGSQGNPAINYAVEKFAVETAKPMCLVCSRIALAKELTETEKGKQILSKVNVNKYIENNNVPGSSLTYLNALTDRQVNAYPSDFENKFTNPDVKQTDQIAFVFSQVLVEGDEPLLQAIRSGTNTGVVVGGGLLLNPLGRTFSWASAATILITIAGSGAYTFYQAGQNQLIAAAHCNKLTSSKENRYGCSIVAPIDYNNKSIINSLCTKIEGSL